MENADFPPAPLPSSDVFFLMEEAAGKLKQSSTPLRRSQPASFWEQGSQESSFETLF